MKKMSFPATADSAYGKKIAEYGKKDKDGNLITSVDFKVEFDGFENHPEVVAAKAEPDNDEVTKWANNKRKSGARAKQLKVALKEIGIEPPDQNDPKVIEANVLKDLDRLGVTGEDREMMKAILTKAAQAKLAESATA